MLLRIVQDRFGISNVIVVMLSLILIVIIVSNVVLWNFQMNQFDWEKSQESFEIVDVRNSWLNNPSVYLLGGYTSLVSGSVSDLKLNDGAYVTFASYASATSSQSLFAHAETAIMGGTICYVYKVDSADGPAVTLSVPMGFLGRQLFGRFVYPLSGIGFIPAGNWMFYYRAWHSSVASSAQTVVLRPNRAGAYTEWTAVYPSGIPHWSAVDDVDSDGDSSYIQTSTQGSRDLFGLTEIINHGLVNRVKVYVSAKKLSSSAATFNIIMRTHDTDYFSGSFSLSTSYTYYSYIWTKNPYTNADWTFDEVNSLEVGVLCDGTRNVRVTQIYVEVEYAPQPVEGHVDVDIIVRKSDGSVRDFIATGVANSTLLTDAVQTLSASYSWPGYSVIDQTDYLEIDYYCTVTAANSDAIAYLRIDDNTLAEADQTRVANVMLPCEYSLEVEFIGSCDTNNWSKLVWSIDSTFTVESVTVTLQLYNYSANEYAASGSGYISYISGAANIDELKNQTITDNPNCFKNASGNWMMKIKAFKETNKQFTLKVDWIEFKSMIEGAFFTFKNNGPNTVHLISLWIINATFHQRYDIDVFVNSQEKLSIIREDVHLPDDEWTARIVTERGSVAVFSKHSGS